MDAIGAHFKYDDLTDRLNKVVIENRSEKRSHELLMYQAHFSKNDPEQLAY